MTANALHAVVLIAFFDTTSRHEALATSLVLPLIAIMALYLRHQRFVINSN